MFIVKDQQSIFDVIVVGGGHAGVEAAYAAAKMGSKTLLLTLDKEKIALMPCNPSIGGLGKGHIVFEISAFGGLMPQLCSATYLQARMLNTKKGPAVQGLRLQVDKFKYSAKAQQALKQCINLTIAEGMVIEILYNETLDVLKTVTGVRCQGDKEFLAKSVVITAGTFLNGTIHIGKQVQSAGRMGEKAAIGLSESLSKILGVAIQRLKTGTPPRLLRASIDFAQIEKQAAHNLKYLFEFRAVKPEEKESCYITATNEETHKIIHDNLEESAMYGGIITGVGPRYCPSIEDKIARFPDRKSHHVFIEPEGQDCDEIYPAGLSTSLPIEIQNEYVHSIKGLEKAVITKPGYAVEYDFIQPTHLKHSLESKKIAGLFCAGQINGTTGYEEAAGQGLIAGINAHLKVCDQEPFIVDRTESYIGVMIDDLVTIGVDEPYRMFTSRAERRLLLRQDNAFVRLMPYGKKLGLVSDELYDEFLVEKAMLEKSISHIEKVSRSHEIYKNCLAVGFADDDKDKLKTFLEEKMQLRGAHLSDRVLLGIHAHVKYSGYLEREIREVEKMKKFQLMPLSGLLDYKTMQGLSIELREKLFRFKPQTIAQAQLIPGMTPAAISLLIFQTRLAMKVK